MITFDEIFKNKFLDTAVETFSVVDVTFALVSAALLGWLIFLIYRKTFGDGVRDAVLVSYNGEYNL